MNRNPWVDAAMARVARMTPAERARWELSRAMPQKQVFTAKQFPTRTAWGLFLSSMGQEEVLFGTLPDRYVVTGKENVLDARDTKEKAIAGVARCSACRKESNGVARYRLVGTNGVEVEMHLCAHDARMYAFDPIYGVASVELAPFNEEN